jgi:uridine phosphorylase
MIQESELVLAQDGSLYHLHLKGEQIADNVILVGDPQLVDFFKPFFSHIEQETTNREIHSITGECKGKRLTVLSTGMGTDNIDIIINELNAAVNMDLEKRTAKSSHRRLNFIRIGTSGALHSEIPVGSIVASEYAIGLDGLLNFYKHNSSLFEEDMTEAFCQHAKLASCFAKPYIAQCDNKLMEKLAFDCHKGITATAPGFYAPQGRWLTIEPAIDDINGILTSFGYKTNKILNFEMETSAIYGLSRVLGHNALTLCLIIANRQSGTFLNDYKDRMKALIEQVLERLSQM